MRRFTKEPVVIVGAKGQQVLIPPRNIWRKNPGAEFVFLDYQYRRVFRDDGLVKVRYDKPKIPSGQKPDLG